MLEGAETGGSCRGQCVWKGQLGQAPTGSHASGERDGHRQGLQPQALGKGQVRSMTLGDMAGKCQARGWRARCTGGCTPALGPNLGLLICGTGEDGNDGLVGGLEAD